MSTRTSYRLGEVRGHADDPRHEIPPAPIREDLEPGELAWLMVEFPEETAPAWAEVRRVLGPGWYLGKTEDGEPVEFGAEHVFGVNGPRYQMGAWYDFLPGARPTPRKPAAPPPPPAPEVQAPRWYEFLPSGPRASAKGPSIFDVWKRGAPAEPVGPGESKRSFWEFFGRRPKAQVEPIPPAERRERRPSFLRLPGTPPEPPAPPAPPESAYEAPAGRPQEFILPEAPREVSMPPRGAQSPPDDLFDVLLPSLPAAPGAPPPPPAPGSLIVGPATLPATVDAFSVLEPAPVEAYGPPAQLESSFTMIQPAEAPTPFDMLEPEASSPQQGLVVRPEQGVSTSSAFDVLEPALQPLAPYQAPPAPGPTVFDAIEPERKAEPTRKKSAKKKQPQAWRMPSQEEWVRWVRDTWKTEELWDYIREERDSEFFVGLQENEEYTGEAPTVPIETWADSDWDSIFGFFGIPKSAYQPYLERISKEEEELGYYDEAWGDFQETFLYPLAVAVGNAFESIKPSDLPGRFVMDDDTTSGTWGILYYEPMDPKTQAKRRKEGARKAEIEEREQKEVRHHRKAEIKRIWGSMPKPEDLVPWIEEKFDIETMFRDIQKTVKTKGWNKELREYGESVMALDKIADLGPNKAKDYEYEIAAYFGIPPDLIALYEDAPSRQELWNDIFWPFFDSVSEAFTMLVPYANLPGMITIDEDEEDRLMLQYVEQEESED